MPKTIKQKFSAESIAELRERFEKFLDAESGSIIIIAGNKVIDMHHNICRKCVEKALQTVISDADYLGMFAAHSH